MQRRIFVSAVVVAVATAKQILGAQQGRSSRLGICTFSCHRHWNAVKQEPELTKFRDAPTFLKYTRELGADGVQTSVTSMNAKAIKLFRQQVELLGGYYEGDIRLPQNEADLPQFEEAVRLTRLAGATVARSVLSGSRRYETWNTLDQFHAFQDQAAKRLAMVEPILQRHALKLAIENHKDLTVEELSQLMRRISSEWIGVNVDTGNNLALLDDPYETIDALAPYALSVHLKDMALQESDDGFLLSEVPCGSGFLDLPRIVATLRKANADIAFNLEMATRDPLRIPCKTTNYWSTFPQRKNTHFEPAMALVKAHPPRIPLPRITGLTLSEQLVAEELHNSNSLDWMHKHLI